eukprot:scaffold166070_cov17-Prasinocladus_malaysianus.AAC.1
MFVKTYCVPGRCDGVVATMPPAGIGCCNIGQTKICLQSYRRLVAAVKQVDYINWICEQYIPPESIVVSRKDVITMASPGLWMAAGSLC